MSSLRDSVFFLVYPGLRPGLSHVVPPALAGTTSMATFWAETAALAVRHTIVYMFAKEKACKRS